MRLAYLCILLLATNLAFGQSYYSFTPIESQHGLAENRVRNINQLADGRLVVVTEGMVSLYNGTYFKNIHVDENRLIPLSGYTGFHHSYVDNEGHLWLKTRGRLMLIDLLKERFENQFDSVLKSLGFNEPLADFFMDNNRNLWIISSTGKLFYRNEKLQQTRLFLPNVYRGNGVSDNVYDINVVNHKLLLFYRSGLLVCFDIASGKELYRENPLDAERQKRYNATLFTLQQGQVLYQLRNGKSGIMLRYDVAKRKWSTVLETDYWLNMLSADKQGNLWLSCREGLWYIDKTLQKKQFIPTLHLVDGRSINSEVSTLYNDKQGGLWIGTLNRGLLYYHPQRFKFRNIGKTYFNVSGNNDLAVTSFTQAPNDDFLVGTHQGLYTLSKSTAKLAPYSPKLTTIQCNSLLKDRAGRIWICSKDGLYCINKGKLQLYPLGRINTAFEAKDGTLYLGTHQNGFGVFNPITSTYQKASAKVRNGNEPRSVSQLITWNQRLLGISNEGLFVFNPKNQTLEYPSKSTGKPAMLNPSNHHYNCIFADSRGLLWIGTQDGLNVWSEKENRLRPFYTSDGLINSNIKAIAEDKNHTIWLTTSYGVSRMFVKGQKGKYSYSITNFNKYDGLIEGEFIERSVHVAKDGWLMMGGIDGFNFINTDSIATSRHTFTPVFSGFQLFNKQVKENVAYDGNIILPNSISSTRELSLNYGQNFFTIEFSALNYINPTQTYYSYKLEGVDKSWHEISSADGMGQVSYTDLSPGTYIFKVKAADNSRNWNGGTQILKITIHAPFWNTPLAMAVYVVLALFVLYFAISGYIKSARRKLLAQQKEQLDEAKFSFFTNMSHELRTPLTLILTPLNAILEKQQEGELKRALEGIYRNANHLLALVNQLLDFRKLELSGQELHLSLCNIREFTEVLCLPFRGLAKDKEIRFTCKSSFKDLYTYLDKEKLNIVLNNLLSNAFKFTPAQGSVTIELDILQGEGEAQEQLCIRVSDSGIGIEAEDLPRIFEKFYQGKNQFDGNTGSGIGLHLVHEYVKLHGGTIKAESEINAGTKVEILIPVNLQPSVESVGDLPAAVSETEDKAFKILVVEDNREFRDFLVSQLSIHYKVISAVNGKDGLEKAIYHEVEMVISDVMMPVMDGLSLCSALKADIRTSHIPVALLTARSSTEAEYQGYEVGADAYISKPFNMNILLLRIKNLLEQQESRRSKYSKSIEIEPAEITTTGIDEKFIQKALELINSKMDNANYSVEQFSSDMNMERSGLYKKLVSITGQTPSGFIRSVRLKRAALLLKESGFSIGEIAEKVGFNNFAYFSKCFFEEFGVKPSQYRK